MIDLLRQQLEEQGFRFTGRQLGEGGFGAVEVAVVGGIERAVKVSKEPIEASVHVEKELERLEYIKQLTQHRCIVGLIQYQTVQVTHRGETRRYLVTVWELADASLADRRDSISQRQLLDYLQDVAEALDYLHGKGIHHRDIKPHNILVFDDDGHARLGDLGLARMVEQTATATRVVSLGFTPPEILTSGRSYPASDLYSLACSYVWMRTGSFPGELFVEDPDGRERLDELSDSESELVLQALHPDAAQRFGEGIVRWVELLREAVKPAELTHGGSPPAETALAKPARHDAAPKEVAVERPESVPGSSPRSRSSRYLLVLVVAALTLLCTSLHRTTFFLAKPGLHAEFFDAPPLSAGEWLQVSTVIFLAGLAIGGFLFGSVADRIGRVRTIVVALLMSALFTGLTALSQGWFDFTAYSFFKAMGSGGLLFVVVTLVAEVVPDKARPYALVLMLVLISIADFADRLLDHLSWREMNAIVAVPAVLVAVLCIWVKEPDTWSQARHEGPTTRRFGSYAALLRDRRWGKHAALAGILGCSAAIGAWSAWYFANNLTYAIERPAVANEVFEERIEQARTDGDRTLVEQLTRLQVDEREGKYPELPPEVETVRAEVRDAIGSKLAAKSRSRARWTVVIGTFLSLGFAVSAQWIGRRLTFAATILAAFASALCLFVFLEDGSQMWLHVAMFSCLEVLYVGYVIYFPELFPTHLRSTGSAFCYNMGRLAIAGVPLMEPALWGVGAPTGGMATCGIFLLGLVVLPFLPETKNQPLPESDADETGKPRSAVLTLLAILAGGAVILLALFLLPAAFQQRGSESPESEKDTKKETDENWGRDEKGGEDGVASGAAIESGVVNLTPANTFIGFSVSDRRYATRYTNEGWFTDFAGTIRVDENTQTMTDIAIVIETTSLQTEGGLLLSRWLGADCFNAAQYPQARFESTRILHDDDGHYVSVEGNMTLRNTTKPIAFSGWVTIADRRLTVVRSEGWIIPTRFGIDCEDVDLIIRIGDVADFYRRMGDDNPRYNPR